MQCLIGLRASPSSAEIDRIVDGAVVQFLDGCQVTVGGETRRKPRGPS
jgi:hypothetical protein